MILHTLAPTKGAMATPRPVVTLAPINPEAGQTHPAAESQKHQPLQRLTAKTRVMTLPECMKNHPSPKTPPRAMKIPQRGWERRARITTRPNRLSPTPSRPRQSRPRGGGGGLVGTDRLDTETTG